MKKVLFIVAVVAVCALHNLQPVRGITSSKTSVELEPGDDGTIPPPKPPCPYCP